MTSTRTLVLVCAALALPSFCPAQYTITGDVTYCGHAALVGFPADSPTPLDLPFSTRGGDCDPYLSKVSAWGYARPLPLGDSHFDYEVKATVSSNYFANGELTSRLHGTLTYEKDYAEASEFATAVVSHTYKLQNAVVPQRNDIGVGLVLSRVSMKIFDHGSILFNFHEELSKPGVLSNEWRAILQLSKCPCSFDIELEAAAATNSYSLGTAEASAQDPLQIGVPPGWKYTFKVGSDTFTSGSTPAATGLRFVPLPPCRVMETRSLYNFEGRTGPFGPPSLNGGDTRTLNLPASTVCSIPSTAKAYVVNTTVIPQSGLGFATLWPAGDTRPNVWTIRSPDGQAVANSAIVKAGVNGGISVYASDRTDLLIDISGYYTDSTAATGLAYYPLTPCRVIETRNAYRSPPGPFGPPSMSARQTRKFTFPSTPYCTVPTAAAYSVTITAVPPGPLPYLTAWPDGGAQPNVSSINSFAGRVLANSVIVPAAPDGSIDVFAFDTTDFIIDINGYYAPDNGQGLFYYPVTQCRASDSTVSGGAYADETSRTINIPAATGCSGIPSTAKGYAMNVTALPNGNPMPFLTAWPTGSARPNASILNAFQGQIVSNSAIVPAGTNGAIDIYAFRRTDVVVEVSGYFGR